MAQTKLSIPIVYEDDSLLVVDKPAGLVVHPGAGTKGETLTEQLLNDFPALRELPRHGLVHRLDKGTSGVLLLAKTATAATALGHQFADRSVKKRYRALVRGIPAEPTGVIDAPITRHHADRKKMAVRPDGRPAETRYRVVRRLTDAALLDVFPSTGRTHQIRVHLAALGHPVVGDATYGSPNPELGRPFLHAAELTVSHPSTGRSMTFTAPLPEELTNFLKRHG